MDKTIDNPDLVKIANKVEQQAPTLSFTQLSEFASVAEVIGRVQNSQLQDKLSEQFFALMQKTAAKNA